MSDAQLLKVLKQTKAAAGGPGKTVEELCLEIFGDTTHHNKNKTRDRIRAEMAGGRVMNGRGFRTNMAGGSQSVPVYRLVEKDK